MNRFGKVLIDKNYEDKDLAGRVYKVTGQSETHYTIEDGWLAECYSVEKDKCKILEDNYEREGYSTN